MLNGEFANEQAELFADRLGREAPGDLAAQVRRAVRLTTGAEPRRRRGRGATSPGSQAVRGRRRARPTDGALTQYCLLALNLNEFIYLD